MEILNKVLSKVKFKKKEKPISLIKEALSNPDKFKMEMYVENDEIIIKMKKRESE